LVYYPLATVMLAGVREILLIVRPEDEAQYRALFGDGSQLGISIDYRSQSAPRGIAEAFLIGADFIGKDGVVLALGDNIFFGQGLRVFLEDARAYRDGATIFSYWVDDPERFGVVEFDADNRAIDLVEKPKNPKSNYAVTGLYFYDSGVVDIARGLKPSPRGELEITDVNRTYLAQGRLQCKQLGRGFAWLDTGTPDALLDAANYIATIERRQGLKIACIEEIAWRNGWIDDAQLQRLAATHGETLYGQYFTKLLKFGK